MWDEEKIGELIHLGEVSSTNEYLKSLINEKPREQWLCVYSDFQSKGKGQPGNVWESLSGKNLLCSIYFKAENFKVENSFMLNEWVSISIYNVLESLGLNKVLIKWPNDILVNKKKICGVLIENTVSGKRISESIIGIGLNVNDFPKHLDSTSIEYELGISLSVKNVLNKLHVELRKNSFLLEMNPMTLKGFYLKNLLGYSEKVWLKDSKNTWEGRVVGVSALGLIEVEKEGVLNKYSFKELEWIGISN